MVCFRALNGREAISGFIAPVRGSGFKKVSDGAAHGGTVINDKDSGFAIGGTAFYSHVSAPGSVVCTVRSQASLCLAFVASYLC